MGSRTPTDELFETFRNVNRDEFLSQTFAVVSENCFVRTLPKSASQMGSRAAHLNYSMFLPSTDFCSLEVICWPVVVGVDGSSLKAQSFKPLAVLLSATKSRLYACLNTPYYVGL